MHRWMHTGMYVQQGRDFYLWLHTYLNAHPMVMHIGTMPLRANYIFAPKGISPHMHAPLDAHGVHVQEERDFYL